MWPIIQGIILVLGSLLFIAIADKFKRRTLLMIGGFVMGLSFILPAIIHIFAPSTNPILIVVFLSIYVAFYSFTWAPLTWVIVGEIFPLAIRGLAWSLLGITVLLKMNLSNLAMMLRQRLILE